MQKRIEDKLYVFDLVPFEITDGTDAEVIYVQYEHVAGYKELNASIADKIAGFNQFVITVNPPVWAQAGPEPGPQGYSFSLSGYDIQSHVKVYFDNVEQTITDGNWSNIAEGTSIIISAEENPEWYTVTNEDPANILVWNQSRLEWQITMPAEDVSVSIDYHEDQGGDTFTYTFTLSGTDIEQAVQITANDTELVLDANGQAPLHEGDIVKIQPINDPVNYELVSGAEWSSNDEAWVFTMPAEAHTVVINFIEPAETYTFAFQTNDTSVFGIEINGESKDVTEGSWDVAEGATIVITPTQTFSDYSIVSDEDQLVSEDNGTWTLSMPGWHYTVGIDYNGGESGDITPESYTFTFLTNDSSAFGLSINAVSKDPSDGSWNDVLEGEEILITLTDPDQAYGTYSTSDDDGASVIPTWDGTSQTYSVTMPDHDIQVHIDYDTSGASGGESGESE